ncbi:MAG: hypothetical protein J0H47_00175 [Gammaproteobacteria bacterium]|nr:hypothetical protein [Gammaproteobacteria bacterium]
MKATIDEDNVRKYETDITYKTDEELAKLSKELAEKIRLGSPGEDLRLVRRDLQNINAEQINRKKPKYKSPKMPKTTKEEYENEFKRLFKAYIDDNFGAGKFQEMKAQFNKELIAHHEKALMDCFSPTLLKRLDNLDSAFKLAEDEETAEKMRAALIPLIMENFQQLIEIEESKIRFLQNSKEDLKAAKNLSGIKVSSKGEQYCLDLCKARLKGAKEQLAAMKQNPESVAGKFADKLLDNFQVTEVLLKKVKEAQQSSLMQMEEATPSTSRPEAITHSRERSPKLAASEKQAEDLGSANKETPRKLSKN